MDKIQVAGVTHEFSLKFSILSESKSIILDRRERERERKNFSKFINDSFSNFLKISKSRRIIVDRKKIKTTKERIKHQIFHSKFVNEEFS